MKYNLSEITDVIKNRRTIYPTFFSSRKVHKEIVEKILGLKHKTIISVTIFLLTIYIISLL